MEGSNIGVIQLNVFEADVDSREEELIVQGLLQVDVSE